MMRVRVSHLDGFRHVLDGWKDEAELADAVRGRPHEPNWQMSAGSAFHQLLARDDPQPIRLAMCERKRGRGNVYPTAIAAQAAAALVRLESGAPVEAFRCATCGDFHIGKPADDEEDLGRLEQGGWSFRRADWRAVRDHQGPGLREVPASLTLGGTVVYSEGCDHLRGRVVRDTKCCFGNVDPSWYEAALQWRFYLLLHEADCFAYDLLEFREDEHRCELGGITTVRFWRYPQMEQDCRAWLDRFVAWAERLPTIAEAA